MYYLIITIFIICATLLFLLFSYPVFSYLYGVFFPKSIKCDLNYIPQVSIIVACYNEERYIKEKIETLLSPENWIAGSQLILVSTGSSDRTNEILSQFEQKEGVNIIYGKRMTKIEALNDAVSLAKYEILVFSDCRQYMKPGSIKQLISYLADESVGTVSCTMMDTVERPSFFRRLYLYLAKIDSRHGSSLNLYGALYAQRKSVFRPIPNHLLFDDFFVAVSTLSQQKRLVQAPEAILYDVPFNTYYNRERIERLARGLLIFFFNNYKMVRLIPLPIRLRLLIYKYLKILLPVIVIIWFICFVLLFGNIIPFIFWIIPIGVIIILSLFHKIRNYLFLIIRIQVFFFYALFGYIFLNRRFKYWDKLRVRRESAAIAK